MNIFCLAEFKVEFEKLKSKKSYNSIEGDVIDYFFDKSVQDLSSGTRLNNSNETPYIKKRINGRGGFRFYFLLIIKDENLYLMFVHPKTGSLGYENITDDSKAYLYKKILECIKNKELLELTLNLEKTNIIFKKAQ
jgi:hypothetical protein